MALARVETKSTTVRIPVSLYEQAKDMVCKEKASAASVNDIIVAAIRAYVKMYERRRIDAAFAGMSQDADYQKEAALLSEEFDHSDWEALRMDDQDPVGEPNRVLAESR
jgi:hypothetical protein